MKQVILATSDQEVAPLYGRALEPLGIELIAAPEMLPKSGRIQRPEDEAAERARAYVRKFKVPAIVEVWNLSVSALKGLPGAATEHLSTAKINWNQHTIVDLQIEKAPVARECVRFLLQNMQRKTDRDASLAVYIAYAGVDPSDFVVCPFSTVVRIAYDSRGKGGWIYDCVCEVTEGSHLGRTLAELTAEQRKHVCPREKAIGLLAAQLQHTGQLV